MDVFDLRRRVIDDYAGYVRSFFAIRDERIRARVDAELAAGRLPVLRDKELRAHGTYRTKDLVLDRYTALAAAISTRTPYVSPLSPPPASPFAAHPETS